MRKLRQHLLIIMGMLVPAGMGALAQVGAIKGSVLDEQTGKSIQGATVFLEKTSYGTAADASGNYIIDRIPQGSYTLVVSLVGYRQSRQAVTVKPDEVLTIVVRLKTGEVTLSPVVITAIGTEAEREKLGTSVSSVEGSSINRTGAHDVVSSLAVLAPGVNTIETTGDPGSATRIVLRGVRSLQNGNQPLIVLDGVPINNDLSIGNWTSGPAPYSRIADLNTEDIQSLELYKGPSAASLWGSRAANGVINITTRSGGYTPGQKLNISVRSTISADQLLNHFPLQTTFGQGVDGSFVFNSSTSWGDKISLRSGGADSLSRMNYPYATIIKKNSQAVYDHAAELFRTSVTWNYGVTLRGGDEWGDYYLDVDRLDQEGIVQTNSDLKRTSLRGSTSRHFSENVTARFNASYVKTSSSRIQQGSNLSGLLLGGYRTPPDFNNEPYVVDYVSSSGAIVGGMQRTYRNGEGNPADGPGYDNPFFVINNVPTLVETDRLFGGGELVYDALDWMKFDCRFGVDYYTDRLSSTHPVGDATVLDGDTYRGVNSAFQFNTDIQSRLTHTLNDNASGSLLLGFHLDHSRWDGTSVYAQRFVLDEAPATFTNALDYTPNEYQVTTRAAAMYGELAADLYRQLFLRLSGRAESASTYGPEATKIYFYPSASAAWQFTQMPFLQQNTILSFGKLRAAYGVAANQPPAYVTRTYFTNAVFYGWDYALNALFYNGGTVRSWQLGNPYLKPEMTREFELGADVRFLSDRISLGVTKYWSTTTDAIVSANIAPSSGFSNKIVNGVSMENVGTEIQIMAEWIRVQPFSWSTTINWWRNKNQVTNLAGVQSVFLNGLTEASSRAVLNQPVGVLYGSRWARDATGALDLDPNGFPRSAPDPGVLGDPNPDWRAGIINTFRYDRLTLNVVIDIKNGGVVLNGTKGALYYFGTHGDQQWWSTVTATQAATLKNYDGITPDQLTAAGSNRYMRNPDGSVSFRGYVTDFGGGPVLIDEAYFQNGPGSFFTGPAEQFVENGGYVRLREVSLSYLLPLQFFGVQSFTFTATGRNLAIWTDYTGHDPETNLTGPGDNSLGIDYFNNPTTRSWIFKLQMDF